MLFAIATNITSMQMLERDENDFKHQEKRLFLYLAITAFILAILGQSMAKANRGAEVERLIQLGESVNSNSDEFKQLRIGYYKDFKGKSGKEVESLIDKVKNQIDPL
jgi:hypothetical protein